MQDKKEKDCDQDDLNQTNDRVGYKRTRKESQDHINDEVSLNLAENKDTENVRRRDKKLERKMGGNSGPDKISKMSERGSEL